jgi:hypothetical protein
MADEFVIDKLKQWGFQEFEKFKRKYYSKMSYSE